MSKSRLMISVGLERVATPGIELELLTGCSLWLVNF